MLPPQFEYYAPKSVDDAVALLSRFSGEAKVLAGGQSLLPMMKLRQAAPSVLIDLGRIPDLSYIREEGEYLRIGTATRTSDLLGSDVVRKSYPILADAARCIADPLVRNLGTVGGNVCFADPGNDLPACIVAFGGHLVAQGPGGSRSVAAVEFYKDTFVTALEPDELLVELRIPRTAAHQGSAYEKVSERPGDFAIAGVGASLVLDDNGVVTHAGLGLTGVGPTVRVAKTAAGTLVGTPADPTHAEAAAKLAVEASQPSDDARGPADYKRAMVEVLTRRVLARSLARAKGGA